MQSKITKEICDIRKFSHVDFLILQKYEFVADPNQINTNALTIHNGSEFSYGVLFHMKDGYWRYNGSTYKSIGDILYSYMLEKYSYALAAKLQTEQRAKDASEAFKKIDDMKEELQRFISLQKYNFREE